MATPKSFMASTQAGELTQGDHDEDFICALSTFYCSRLARIEGESFHKTYDVSPPARAAVGLRWRGHRDGMARIGRVAPISWSQSAG
jgi:hypothetical protein